MPARNQHTHSNAQGSKLPLGFLSLGCLLLCVQSKDWSKYTSYRPASRSLPLTAFDWPFALRVQGSGRCHPKAFNSPNTETKPQRLQWQPSDLSNPVSSLVQLGRSPHPTPPKEKSSPLNPVPVRIKAGAALLERPRGLPAGRGNGNSSPVQLFPGANLGP